MLLIRAPNSHRQHKLNVQTLCQKKHSPLHQHAHACFSSCHQMVILPLQRITLLKLMKSEFMQNTSLSWALVWRWTSIYNFFSIDHSEVWNVSQSTGSSRSAVEQATSKGNQGQLCSHTGRVRKIFSPCDHVNH